MAESPLANVQLRLVESIDDLMDMKRWAGERRETPMGVDTESGGLDPWKTKLRSIQVGDKNHGWFVPWERWGGGALEILNNYEGGFTWHNLPHDAKFMKVHAGYDMPWSRCDDTMIGARVEDPTQAAGLKPQVSKRIDPTALAGQKALDEGMSKQGWTWATVPIDFPPYWIYGAMDPVLNCHLWEKIIPTVRQRSPEVYDLEMATLRICTAMMLKGMRLDPPYMERERAKLRDFSLEARAWLKATYGVTSPMSGGQLGKAFTELGQELEFFTDQGAPQFNKDALLAYQANAVSQEVADFVRYILAVRHADKMVGTYLNNFFEMMDSEHVLHCSINSLKAITSRMSISDPSLQNLPRDDKMIRGSFVPREGKWFISCDADQIEMRLVAHLSRDPGLIQAFFEADQPDAPDFFTVIASTMYGEPVTKKDPRRQLTKNSMYARNYGAGIAKIAKTAGVPFEQVETLNRKLDALYPGLPVFMRETINGAVALSRAGKRPYVTTEMGRYLPGNKRDEFKLLNYLIQGSAAEALKRGMVNLDAAGLLDYMLIPIHDEVLFEVPAGGEAYEIKHLIEETLTDRTSYSVPISWSADIMEERWTKL